MALSISRRFGHDWPEQWRRRWFGVALEPQERLWIEEIQGAGIALSGRSFLVFDPDQDIGVSVTDSMLDISAKHQELAGHTDKESYRSEVRHGEFCLDLSLPPAPTRKAIKVSHEDGILEVRISWPAESDPTSINVPVSRY